MKRLSTALILLMLAGAAFGQDVKEQTIPYSGQELDIDMDFGDEAIIKAWDKNEIYVKVTYEINQGDLNEALRLDIDDYKDRLSIDVDLNERMLRNSRFGDCSRRDHNGSYYNGDGYSACVEITVEVFLPKASDVWVNTVVADVEVEGMEGNIEIETVTGHIDVTWTEGKGADVKMKTVTGAVYTNLEFDRRRDKGLRIISSHDIKGRHGSGGKEVSLETVTSDIYLRKGD